jgi:hypothetical protein
MLLQSTAALATSPLHEGSGDGSSSEEMPSSHAFHLLLRLSLQSRLAIWRFLCYALRAARLWRRYVHVTTTAITASTKRPQATTATITNKSPRASLQLTHELRGYIRRMRSRAPTENLKNATKTKISRLSLSVTP